MTRVKITDAVRSKIKAEKQRTKVSFAQIVKMNHGDPKMPPYYTIDNIATGRVVTARKDQLECILRAYGDLPDAHKRKDNARPVPEGRIFISDNALAELQEFFANSEVTPTTLIRGREGRPVDLHYSDIRSWVSGKAKIAVKAHLEYVLSAIRNYDLDAVTKQSFTISAEQQKELVRLKEQTLIPPSLLVKTMPHVPEGLRSDIVRSWMYGQPVRVRRDHYHAVVSHWQKQTKTTQYRKKDFNAIKRELKRTGATPYLIMKIAKNSPAGFIGSTVKAFLDEKTSRIKPDHLEYILKLLHSMPSIDDPSQKTKKKRALTSRPDDLEALRESDRIKLRSHYERTGIGPTALLRMHEKSKPSMLSATIISSWVNGYATSASKSRLNWVLKKWAALPDQPKQ